MAGVSYNRFLREVQAHNIVILAENGFLDRMAALADTVNDDRLRIAVEKAIMQEAERSTSKVDQS